MKELREDFIPASSTIQGFFEWMDERHSIYLKRSRNVPRPWTDDPIMNTYKFTNVFRELDPGTIALRKMEKQYVYNYLTGHWPELAGLIVFNTWWYRIWNYEPHASALGFVTAFEQLEEYMLKLHAEGGRMWTSAHMVRGAPKETKVSTYLRMLKEVWNSQDNIAKQIIDGKTLQNAFNVLLLTPLIGDFTSYEITSDLRWNLLTEAPDKLTWGNPGNGAERGLRRLGLEESYESMEWLWLKAPEVLSSLESEVLRHYPVAFDGATVYPDTPREHQWPPFEIREIEHSLCEFDKYERARLGQGRPRSKYIK